MVIVSQIFTFVNDILYFLHKKTQEAYILAFLLFLL